MAQTAAAEALMTAVLHGEAMAWPLPEPPGFRQAFRQAGDYHGVRPLLSRALQADPGPDWPPSVRASLLSEARAQAAHELVRKRELQRILGILAASGIQPLLMKGTALAYTHYAAPAFRPRGDTDLWVRPEDAAVAHRLLPASGYTQSPGISGTLVATQASYTRMDELGVAHVLDLHWRISNTQIFARALTYAEAARDAVPIPSLGRHARTLGAAHALLLACMHRVGHQTAPYYVGEIPYFGGDRLIWLYDIHLLVARMKPEELRDFAESAARKGLRAIALDGLQCARASLGTEVPADILDRLASGPRERSARLLRHGRWQKWLLEFQAVGGWRDRLTLAREHLFPPGPYMLAKYGTENRLLLPALYLHRAVRGVWKNLRAPIR